MKMLSFNCRGLASPDKKLAMRKLFLFEPFDILFLQETLGQGIVSLATFMNHGYLDRLFTL